MRVLIEKVDMLNWNQSYATHHSAQFYEDTRVPHATVVKLLVKYLASTKKDELILDPQRTKSLEEFVVETLSPPPSWMKIGDIAQDWI